MQYPNPPGLPGSYPERSENDLILGLLVSPGYFFITLVLLVGLALGDESEYGVKLKLSNHSRFCFTFVGAFPLDMRTIMVSLSDVSLQHVRLPTPPQRRSSRDRCSKRFRGKRSRGRFFKLFTHCNICTICHLWNMLPSLISLPGTGGIFCAWIYVHLDRIDIYDWCNLVCNGYSLQVKEINRLLLVQHFVPPILKHAHSRSSISQGKVFKSVNFCI